MSRVQFVCFPVALTILLFGADRNARAVTWNIDNVASIGGNTTTKYGNPQVVSTSNGNAVLFNGVNDGLLVDSNPIAGAAAFTVEGIFRPDASTSTQPRWLHMQSTVGDDRLTLEARLTGANWYLDTFIKSGAGANNSLTLINSSKLHPLGQWYHVALIYNGATMRHYVNGMEELSGALSVPGIGNGKTSLGVRQNLVNWFGGAIRTVRFTSSALTPDQFLTVPEPPSLVLLACGSLLVLLMLLAWHNRTSWKRG